MISTNPEAGCAAEIVALHRLFESWLGAAGEGHFTRFEAAFAEDFAIVMPNGRKLDRAAVLAFLRDARGSRGPDFRIWIEDAHALHQSGDLVLMHYLERQRVGGQDTARRASALFRMEAAGPRWLFVQETWVRPPM